MNNWFRIQRLWIVLSVIIAFFSYAFVDVNLRLSDNPLFRIIFAPLPILMRSHRGLTAIIFVLLLISLFLLWRKTIQLVRQGQCTLHQLTACILSLFLILIISYPFLSYDLFNYLSTAKVAYTWHENPYLVMPIEIPNEPNLAFTRAANKVALYGPAWLLLTWIPHTLGLGNIWLSIVTFKLTTALFYFGTCYLIWLNTKKLQNVIFFALNPLILMEVLVSGHNDIVMMFFSLLGLWLMLRQKWLGGGLFFITSVFVKGATLMLLPLVVVRHLSQEKIWQIAYWLMLGLFMIAAPLREELYPWYAVWFLSFAALLPWEKRYGFIRGLSAALSVGLEFRHLPYMFMGYYESPGQILRTVATVVPVVLFLIWHMIVNRRKIHA